MGEGSTWVTKRFLRATWYVEGWRIISMSTKRFFRATWYVEGWRIISKSTLRTYKHVLFISLPPPLITPHFLFECYSLYTKLKLKLFPWTWSKSLERWWNVVSAFRGAVYRQPTDGWNGDHGSASRFDGWLISSLPSLDRTLYPS